MYDNSLQKKKSKYDNVLLILYGEIISVCFITLYFLIGQNIVV